MVALDIAVSSLGKAFPLVVGEAMACGTPCVVTDVGDSARIVGDTGVVVPPKNSEALTEGLLHLLTTKERKLLGIAARKRISSMFSIDNIVQQYENLYSEVANSSSKGLHVLP